jgi:hypothetical protein
MPAALSLVGFPGKRPVSPSSCLIAFPLVASPGPGSEKMEDCLLSCPRVSHGQQVLLCARSRLRRILWAAGRGQVVMGTGISVSRTLETLKETSSLQCPLPAL